MWFVILGLALSFLYKSADSSSVPNSCGDRAGLGKGWVLLCFPNPDNTLNITFDCNLNSNEDDVHLRIWYPFYPPEMKSLTIQNCKKLYLVFDIEPKRYVQLHHLHVKNIFQFSIDKRGSARCLPEEVKFESIEQANFSMSLISDDELCKKSNYGSLESLELVNTTIKNLPSNFIWEKSTESTKMERFYMRNCTIENAERNAIVIPKSSTVEIVNTTVKMMEKHFIDIDADRVEIKDNNFMNIPRNSSFPGFSVLKEHIKAFAINAIFAIKAKNVQLNGNTFDFLGKNSLEISSNNIVFYKNIFKRIEENAFRSISFSSINKESQRTFNFLYNQIHSISPRSITSPAEKLGPVDSDFLDIYNNFVVCSCANFAWFDWLARTPNKFNNKWFNEKLTNSCLKVPCGLHQISKNYSRLCEENYECSELPPGDLSLTKKGSETSDRVMVPSNFTKVNQTKNDNLSEFERLLISLERNNNETFKTNSEIIKLLWAESRKMKKN